MLVKRIVNSVLVAIGLLLLSVIIFYFLAGSENYDEFEHSSILEYDTNADLPVTDTFRAITYNIGYLSGMNNNRAVKTDPQQYVENLKGAISLLKDDKIAIVGFQEIDFLSNRSLFMNQMDSIAVHGGYGFGAMAVNWDKRYVPFPYWPPSVQFGQIFSGQAILSKFPIHTTKRVVMPKPKDNPFYYNAFYIDRLVQIVETEIRGRVMTVMNVHLEAYDRSAREIQAGILKSLVEKYVNQNPLLLIGDLNCSPPYPQGAVDEMTIATLLEIDGLESAISMDDYLESPQKHFTYPSDGPRVKLDYIFYNSKYVRKIASGTLHEAGKLSDHLPVYFDFVLLDK